MINLQHTKRRFEVVLAAVLILCAATWIRAIPTVSESLHWDSVDYVRASREGFVANWLDQGHPGIANLGKMFKLDLPYDKTVIRGGVNVFWLRHFHPPMLAYVLRLQERLLGFSDFRVRLFSIVSGAVTCALLVFSVWTLRPTGGLAVMSGVFAGVMLGVTPYHLAVSRTASYHALFPFVLSMFLLALSRGIEKRGGAWLLAAFGLLSLCMATFDWGILLPLVLCGALIVVRNPWLRWQAGTGLCVSPRFLLASAGSVLLFAILWPAGVLKADLLQGIAYNALYSSYALNRTTGMGDHWWDVYAWYYRTAPVVAFLQLAALAYVVFRALSRRESGLWAWLLFGGLFMIVSLRQRQIYVHYLAPLFPVACVFAGVLAHDLGKRLPKVAGMLVPAILGVGCALSAAPKWHRPFTDPAEVPGFSQAATFFKETTDRESSILSTASPLLSFYLDGFDIKGIPLGPMPRDRIEELARHRYRYVLIYRDQLDLVHEFAEDPGYRFVVENLPLRRTIRHLRRGYECMWIYEDTLWARPAKVQISLAVIEQLSARPGFELWHVPLDSLPFGEPDLVQLYFDERIMDRRSGWPYRDWRVGYYAVDAANPRAGLVVAVPAGSSPRWFLEHRYTAAVAPGRQEPSG